MNNCYQHTLSQKKVGHTNLVSSTLKKLGYKEQMIRSLFDNNQIRIRWGRDWNEFTVHMENKFNEPTWEMGELIHLIWKGISVPNYLIVTCFIKSEGVGPVTSLAITDIYTLAAGLKKYGIIQKIKNSINGQSFMTLPFSHFSLSHNIWGMGIRNN